MSLLWVTAVQAYEESDPRRWGMEPPRDVHPADEFPIEHVGYKKLHLPSTKFVSSEPTLDANFIHHLVKHPHAQGSGDGGKMVVEHEGKMHLWDGNHRTAAALARGQEHAFYDVYRTQTEKGE